jgi:hypothetical protein
VVEKSGKTVPYYDMKTKKIIQIPASELAPGLVQVRFQGTDQVVWADLEQLQLSSIRHPPFDEKIMKAIREIEKLFREVHPLSVVEWANGFRRDLEPIKEIVIWLYAGKVYTFFAEKEPSKDRREEIFTIIVNCMNTSYDAIRHVLPPLSMTAEETQKVVDKFYQKKEGS